MRISRFASHRKNSTLLASSALVVMLALSAPVAAEPVTSEPSAEEGGSLMQRGMDLFFKGLQEEMAPTLDDFQMLVEQIGPSMGEFLSYMGPALADIVSRVEDWSAYELPEMLPNGDIIIRKKIKPGVIPEGGPDANGQIEL